MKYIINRTSNFMMYDDDPDIREAKLETLPYHWPEIIKGGIVCCPEKTVIPARDEPTNCYTIEINSIEELHHLITKYGHPIILTNPDKKEGFNFPIIEIYDDYRE